MNLKLNYFFYDRLNDCLIDPIMSAWFRGINASFGTIVLENITEISSIQQGDSDEDEFYKTIRVLQMIEWMLNKYANGNQNMIKDSSVFIEQVTPIIFNGMQTPIVELRDHAVRCLGCFFNFTTNINLCNYSSVYVLKDCPAFQAHQILIRIVKSLCRYVRLKPKKILFVVKLFKPYLTCHLYTLKALRTSWLSRTFSFESWKVEILT